MNISKFTVGDITGFADLRNFTFYNRNFVFEAGKLDYRYVLRANDNSEVYLFYQINNDQLQCWNYVFNNKKKVIEKSIASVIKREDGQPCRAVGC